MSNLKPQAHLKVAVRPSRRRTAKSLPANNPATLLHIIEKAALNRAVDAGKLRHLLEMHGQIHLDQARAAFITALAELQTALPMLAENGEIRLKNGKTHTYALWEDINEVIKPILAEHGFALTFRTGRAPDQILVTGVLSHRGGHSEQTTMHLPLDLSGNKNPVQAVGSSTSYGKRYVAQALLNLTSRGEDDDGMAAGAGPQINEQQLRALDQLIAQTKADRGKFLAYLGLDNLADLPAARFDQAVAALQVREAQP